MSRRAWIQFTYFVGASTAAAREAKRCILFFDIGPGEILDENTFATFTEFLRAGDLPERKSRRGTGKRGRDKVLRPDGLMALQYHLMQRITTSLNLPREVRLRSSSAKMSKYHVASAWGLDRGKGHFTVHNAQRDFRAAALRVINRLDDDEARGLFVRVNGMAVEFAKAGPRRG